MRIVSLIVLIAWAATLLRTIINLTVVPRLRRTSPGPTSNPKVSVLVPARDEARTIERTVRALLAQTYANLEIIVVNDRSTDETGEILARLAGSSENLGEPRSSSGTLLRGTPRNSEELRGSPTNRLIVIDGEEPPPGWLGKPWALHQASRRASGEVLLFVDADVIYEPETVAATVGYLERRPDTGLVALLPRFLMRGFWEHAAMPILAFTVVSAMPLWLSNRTRHRLLAVGGGPGNLVRREVYEAARGHEALRDEVVDDVGLARIVRVAGYRTEAVWADDLVSVRMYHGLREIVEGFTKNAFAVFGNRLAAAFAILVALLLFHGAPFVLAAIGDVIGIVTVALILLTRLILFSALGYPLWSALLLHPVMVGVWSWIFLRSGWYSGIRRKVLWRGRTYDIGRR